MEVQVLRVRPLDNMRLELLFNDGTTRIFNVGVWLNEIPNLEPLADKSLFDSVKPICDGTVVSWRWDIDFSSEFLYKESKIS